MRKNTYTIVYKSGAKVVVRATKLVVYYRGGEITKLEWKDMTPDPLWLGVADIAAVFEGHA